MRAVGDLAERVDYGSSAKTDDEQSGIPVLRMGNIVDGKLQLTGLKYLPTNHDQFPELLLESGDVLFNRTNSLELVGKSALYEGLPARCSFASYLLRVRLGGELHPKLLVWYLNSGAGREWVTSVATQQTGQANVNATKLKELMVPVPPWTEQRRIVAILDEAFDGIAKARANAEKNLANARAGFERALELRFERLSSEYGSRPLESLATDITDGDHMPPPKSNQGIPFVTIGNVNKRTRTLDFSDTFLVSRSYYDSLKAHRKPKRGDVLYTVTGSFGIPILITEDREFCFQRHIGLIRPKPGISSAWLEYMLLAPQTYAAADRLATGAAQRTVSLRALRSLIVPDVPESLQQEVANELNELASEIAQLRTFYEQKLAALDELKKSLLHHAFSGQL